MKCKDVREMMPDMALGLAEACAEAGEHIRNCGACAEKMQDLRKTMALLDEWQAPEVSPFFDTRLEARVREEKAQATAARGFMAWISKPVLAAVATLLLVAGTFWWRGGLQEQRVVQSTNYSQVQPGTAVGDLQALEKNDDLLSGFDVLDDLSVQQDVNANP
jgi:anti-sigma factor RsiW